MATQLNLFRERNCTVSVISSGDSSYIEEFKGITDFQGNIFTDPSRQSFNLLGLTSGIGGLLGMKSITKGFTALREGVKPGLLQGSALQLGGALIVTREEEICYYYKSVEAGDYPPIDEMLAAI